MSNQGDLFDGGAGPAPEWPAGRGARQPLAARMRPRGLSEIVGQEHLTRGDALLPRLIAANSFGSLIFYGPPGCGKTSFAEAIAHETRCRFVRVNAVLSNTAEMRDILAVARHRTDGPTVLFIDELHRFNKSQQDLLLPDVEEGHIRLIGATTHNPGFYVNPPLLSRSHLFRLEPLRPEAVADVLARALTDVERGVGFRACRATPEVLRDLAVLCDGDLRRALNALEVIVLSQGQESEITAAALESFARERRIRYDANEDEHYDTISVFIKSCRGSDPDAALYWLAKMIAGGEDPRFIARRLVILASEDVGLADPLALPTAMAAFQACESIGYPECEYALAHATLYIALAQKSNSATLALAAAKQELAAHPVQPVPLPFRDKSGQASQRAGHGVGYRYSHDFPENISGQHYLARPLTLYTPKTAGMEAKLAERLARWRALRDSLGRDASH